MPLLMTKLRNRLKAEADKQGVSVAITLKNTTVNGDKRGCYGFAKNILNDRCVFVDTEKSVYGGLAGMNLYRNAADEKDYGSSRVPHGYNRFTDDENIAREIIALLISEKSPPRTRD